MRAVIVAILMVLLFPLSVWAQPCNPTNPLSCPYPIYSALGVGAPAPSPGGGVNAVVNFNATNNAFASLNPFNFNANITGAPNDATNIINCQLGLTVSAGNDATDPGASQYSCLVGSVKKNTPAGGFNNGGALYGAWSSYFPFTNNTNLPSSISGSDTLNESDMWTNNLDTSGGRHGFGISFFNQINNGYAGEVSSPFYLNCFVACSQFVHLGGAYEQDAIDLRFASSSEPTITSVTPASPVYSVTVNNVMPLAHGGLASSGYASQASTAAITGITASAGASGTSLTVSALSGLPAAQSGETDLLVTGMYVFDLTNPSAIAANTTITVPTFGTTLTTSVSTTVSSGDSLIFSRGLEPVTINGHSYVVQGITLPNQSLSTAGTVYFNSAVTVADATTGVSLLPRAHTIWMWEGGGAGTPPDDIAFNRSGSVSLGCQNSGCASLQQNGAGLVINSSEGAWSSFNLGKQLLVTTSSSMTNSPAIGLSDNTGLNLAAIFNTPTGLEFAKMPALSDSTDSPTFLLIMSAAAAVFSEGVQTPVIAISALPSCGAGTAGLTEVINNGVSSPTYLGAVSTTGSTVVRVMCNGSGWIYD